MANRYFKEVAKALEAGVIKLYGKVVSTTSGTVGSSTTKGFVVTKTATKTGRYTVTLQDTYMALLGVSVVLVGPDDSAYTTAKGLGWFVRNVSIADATPTFDIQFYRTDTGADAEVMDSVEFYVEVTLKNSTAY